MFLVISLSELGIGTTTCWNQVILLTSWWAR